MGAPEALTVPQVADIFAVSPQTVYKMIYDGTIPVKPFKWGSQWRFSRYQIDQFLKGGDEE